MPEPAALIPAPSRREWIAVVVGIMALTVVFHASALWGHFLVDDWFTLRWLDSLDQLPQLLWGNWMFGERLQNMEQMEYVPTYLYRPIPRISFLLDRSIWGLDTPAGIHLTNLLLHALNAFFLWGIAWTLFRRGRSLSSETRTLAWIAAVLFMIHPLNVESAHWISARTELWAAVFSFPCIWLTLALADGTRFSGARFWSLPLLQLGLMSKETNAVLPAILLSVDLLWQRGWTPRRVAWWALTISLWAWYVVQRKLMFDAILGSPDGEKSDLIFLFINVGAHLRYLVFPFGSPASLSMHLIAVHLLAFLVIGIGLAIHRGHQPGRVILFLFLWIICFMLPPMAAGYDPWQDGLLYHTRLQYALTGAGCILMAISIRGLGLGRPRIMWLIFAFVAVLMTFSSVLAMRDWWRASRGAKQIVQIILDDLERVPPAGPVLIEIPPEKVGRAFMFRTVELGMAITMIAEDRGIDLPLTAAPALLDVNEEDPWQVKPLGSDEPYQTIDTVIYFRLTSRLNEPGRVIYRTVRDGETWSLGEVFPINRD